MSRWFRSLWNKLKTIHISWLGLALIAAGMIILCVILVGRIRQDTAVTQSVRSEKQLLLFEKESERDALQLALDSVGTDEYINREARNANMQSISSIRFRVVNPDDLDKYTEEEWQIILEEQEWDAQ